MSIKNSCRQQNPESVEALSITLCSSSTCYHETITSVTHGCWAEGKGSVTYGLRDRHFSPSLKATSGSKYQGTSSRYRGSPSPVSLLFGSTCTCVLGSSAIAQRASRHNIYSWNSFFWIIFAIISQLSLRVMISALNRLSISSIGLLGVQSRCPLKHRAAQQFSKSRNFKDCKMLWNISLLSMNFAAVNRRNTRLAHRPSFAASDESALWNGLIVKETKTLTTCNQRRSPAPTQLFSPTGKYFIVWKIIILVSNPFQ